MKLTTTKLKQIIKEEHAQLISETEQWSDKDINIPSKRYPEVEEDTRTTAETFIDQFLSFAYMVKSGQVRPDELQKAIQYLAVDAKKAQASSTFDPTGENLE